MRDQLREKIAGEITLSDDPGRTIRKWREVFEVPQLELARRLDVSPSVISDYESGRRRSPGIHIVKKVVDGLLDIDVSRGSPTIRKFGLGERPECVISIKEFASSVPAERFIALIEGENVTPELGLDREIHGYTALDSVKTITSLSSTDYLQIYGWSSERALIFSDVRHGRSPMIAIRAHPLKPAMVVYQRPERVDELAVHLAMLEGVLLVRTELPMEEIVSRMRGL